MVRDFLVAQMPDTGDERVMTLLLRPINRGCLRVRGVQHAVGVVFDDVVSDGVAIAPFWTRFNVHVRHSRSPDVVFYKERYNQMGIIRSSGTGRQAAEEDDKGPEKQPAACNEVHRNPQRTITWFLTPDS